MIKEIFLSVSLIGLWLMPVSSHAATTLLDYYGKIPATNSKSLKNQLFLAVSGFHQPQTNAPDLITKTCVAPSDCYQHAPMSYLKARENLFGHLSLDGSTLSTYSISTIYCHQTLTNKDLSDNGQLGPMRIPDDRVLNAEHSWPQSKFTNKFSTSTQKGDLHILFPVLSVVNSIRGNHPYGEVVTPMNSPCAEAALGKSAEGLTVFEPSDSDKGDVARAVFYFSVRYQAALDDTQEAYLRKWHMMDPVDRNELIKNENVYALQKNRNPFVDAPELVEQIDNF